jgi:RimJ/RimL family protein N-acetyltransferase
MGGTVGLQQIWGQIDRANRPMRGVAENLGFVETGVDPDVVRAAVTLG